MAGSGIVLVTPAFERNSVGRTYCLWLLARALGLSTTVVELNSPTPMWAPLRGTPFEADCSRMDVARSPRAALQARRLLGDAEYVIAVKAMPESLGRALVLSPRPSRVIVDMDDPDTEAKTTWLVGRERRVARLRPRYHAIRALWHAALSHERMVSNPVLQRMYGGSVIPHVREVEAATNTSTRGVTRRTGEVRVAFIGTPRAHKGVEVLRRAVSALSTENFTLTVTGDRPPDAHPWEEWVGTTSLNEGLELVRQSDVIAVPSLDESYARAQFPVKIVDALLASKPVVASDLGALPWAVGPGGSVVPPNDVQALVAALRRFRSVETRSVVGAAGRRHAEQHYTVDAVLPHFEQVLRRVVP